MFSIISYNKDLREGGFINILSILKIICEWNKIIINRIPSCGFEGFLFSGLLASFSERSINQYNKF